MEGYRKQFTHLIPVSHPGPLVLLDGTPNEDDLTIAARLAARFSQGKNAASVRVDVHVKDGETLEMDVPPYLNEDIPVGWYL